MFKFNIILKNLFLIVITANLLSCAPTQPGVIYQLEDKWMSALSQKDTATISPLLDASYMLNGSRNMNETRTQYLSTSAMTERHLEPILLTDRELQLEDNVAISTGSAKYTGKWKDNNFSFAVRYTNVWIRKKGKWKAVATHISTK